MLGFDPSGIEVTVTTEDDTYAADLLIVAAGPWLRGLVDRELARRFTVYRQTLFWFDLGERDDPASAADCPVFIWELQANDAGHLRIPGDRRAQAAA